MENDQSITFLLLDSFIKLLALTRTNDGEIGEYFFIGVFQSSSQAAWVKSSWTIKLDLFQSTEI